AFFSILFKGELPAEPKTDGPPPAQPSVPPASTDHDRAVQMLAILQRDGRLIDFLMEDLTGYSDAQVGTAVREAQAGARKARDRYQTLEPVLPGSEGGPIDVTGTVDPASVRLVGNTSARPPLRGTLLHRGWRTSRIELPPLVTGASRIVAQ